MNLVKVPNLDKVNKKGIYMQYTEGCYCHIFNRGAHKELIFFEEENYRYLITLFNKYSVQYGVTIAAYCCMPNHYHLILKQHEFGSISSFLKTVFNAYTQAINKRFNLSGTLFQGQAKISAIVNDGKTTTPATNSTNIYTTTLTDVISTNNNTPKTFELIQNYPNPFNPTTTICYNLVKVGNLDKVNIRVYDVLGREIAVLVNEEKPAGEYRVKFNASHLPSGVYFYSLSAGNYVDTKKMILAK